MNEQALILSKWIWEYPFITDLVLFVIYIVIVFLTEPAIEKARQRNKGERDEQRTTRF